MISARGSQLAVFLGVLSNSVKSVPHEYFLNEEVLVRCNGSTIEVRTSFAGGATECSEIPASS